MQDTIQTIRHEVDTLLDEGFALFTGAVQGRQSDQALTFMKKHASYQSWYAKTLRVRGTAREETRYKAPTRAAT